MTEIEPAAYATGLTAPPWDIQQIDAAVPASTIIERCSPGPCLELFAYRLRAGWDVWANGVGCDVDLAVE